MYTYTYAHIHTHTYTHTYIHTYTYTHIPDNLVRKGPPGQDTGLGSSKFLWLTLPSGTVDFPRCHTFLNYCVLFHTFNQVGVGTGLFEVKT